MQSLPTIQMAEDKKTFYRFCWTLYDTLVACNGRLIVRQKSIHIERVKYSFSLFRIQHNQRDSPIIIPLVCTIPNSPEIS